MSLPIRAFWLMNSNIGRLLAERDLRGLSLATAAQSGEGTQEIRQHLVIEMGDVGKCENDDALTAKRDQQGVDELKSLSALM